MIALNELRKVELKLDQANYEYGDEECLCIYCKSNNYNGKLGVCHASGCVILYLREQILEALKEEKKEYGKGTLH